MDLSIIYFSRTFYVLKCAANIFTDRYIKGMHESDLSHKPEWLIVDYKWMINNSG